MNDKMKEELDLEDKIRWFKQRKAFVENTIRYWENQQKHIETYIEVNKTNLDELEKQLEKLYELKGENDGLST